MTGLDRMPDVPNWISVFVITILTVSLLVGLPLARHAGVRAAKLARSCELNPAVRKRDRMAMFAALAPTVLVWLAVMGVSFIGLTGFAADVMQWRHWTNILVPLSLDGISVSFGGWAFVAVKHGNHPGRSYKIVLAAAAVSATLNFVHGRDAWSIWAGGYLAFLSLAGMAMFHEMLHQFMAEYNDEVALKARYPRFGQRWLWAPITTLKARRAWIVYPPAEGTKPSINNALEHWRASVRQADRQAASQESVPANETAQVTPLPKTPYPRTHDLSTEASEKPVSYADINEAAERLWLEYKNIGIDLTSSQLLQKFGESYPYRRRIRWAVNRRKAAQTHWTQHLSQT